MGVLETLPATAIAPCDGTCSANICRFNVSPIFKLGGRPILSAEFER